MTQRQTLSWLGWLWGNTPHVCHYCGVSLVRWRADNNIPGNYDPHGKGYATTDHKKALANGGEDVKENVVLCCSICNYRKNIMEYDEYQRVIAPERIARRLKERHYGMGKRRHNNS